MEKGANKAILLVVNPIAGLGGPLALKGTDEETGRRLIMRGVKPISYERARRFFRELRRLGCRPSIVSGSRLGYELAAEQGLDALNVYTPPEWPTRSRDTITLVERGLAYSPSMIIFVGGDGTARLIADVLASRGLVERIPVLGVPAGVKMYSSVYAVNPEAAARITCEYLSGGVGLCDAEVMDIDEEAFRRNELRVRLHSIVKVPCSRLMVGSSKQPSPSTSEEEENKEAIARYVVENYVRDCTLLILGPGTTVAAIAKILGVPKTLLGVDVYHGAKPLALDVDEETLYNILSRHRGGKLLVISPIGGQGYILGRGNQQISPRVLRLIGKDNILVVATRGKMAQLGNRLRVDTGDPTLDAQLRGYIRVLVDYNEFILARVE